MGQGLPNPTQQHEEHAPSACGLPTDGMNRRLLRCRHWIARRSRHARKREPMTSSTYDPVNKFDASRADEYEQQSRIGLAGYDACHELSACILAATLGRGRQAKVLIAGAGGGAKEIVTAGALEKNWRFTAVDPSRPMMDLAEMRIKEAKLADRTEIFLGTVDDLPKGMLFDAATLIGVLHHLPGDAAKMSILRALATRLKPAAPLVVAGNHYAYASQPLLLAAWGERWRLHGASDAEIEAKRGKIMQGADPPHSEHVVEALLAEAGFEKPTRFFSSLFWGAWIARRANH
jgi:tRNA (cmo5U34)-methyltransferase